VDRGDRGAQRANRIRADDGEGVTAASRAGRKAASRVQLDVGRQVGDHICADGCSSSGTVFQGPLVGRRVNLTEVVNASIGLRGGAGFHKVRNRDRRQQTDDGDNNHDFHQCETSFTEVFCHFHFAFFLNYAV